MSERRVASTGTLGALCAVALYTAVGVSDVRRTESVNVVTIGGLNSVPLAAAERQGILAKYGLTVVTEVAPSSQVLRDGLSSGRFDIAHAAADNAIAMVDVAGDDVILVLGGDDSLNELYTQPDIASVSALRGRTVLVDAPNTAYALQLKKILRSNGLEAGRDYTLTPLGATPQRERAMEADPRYAATMLSPPSSILARRAGLVSLGRAAALLGPYQGMSAFVRRAWAREHRNVLVGYIAAYVEGLRWFMAPAHEHEALTLLASHLSLPQDVAEETYRAAVASPGGLAVDAALDVEGLRAVLDLRREIEGGPKHAARAVEHYYDSTYHAEAMTRLGR